MKQEDMNSNKYSRQYDIIKPEELTTTIQIIGAGGIGSWTALALAKMGCSSIRLQDFDEVDESNTGSQIYSKEDIGEPKVIALANIVQKMTEIAPTISMDKWQKGDDPHAPIVIMALDNLDTRREMFAELKKNIDVRLVIDGRMAGDFLRIFFVPLDNNYTEYEKTLVSREAVDPEPCTGKAVVYNVFMVASIIANMVKKFQKGQLTTYKEFAFDFEGLQIL